MTAAEIIAAIVVGAAGGWYGSTLATWLRRKIKRWYDNRGNK